MAIWVFLVFLLGLLALLFDLFHVFTWFAPWWGILLMVLSFGMLTRIRNKEKEGEKEKLQARVDELEGLLKFSV